MTQRIALPLVLLFVLTAQAQAQAPSTDDMDSLARQVLEKNPEITAVEQRILALEQVVDQVGAWKDPVAAIEYSNMPILSPWPGNHAMSGVQLKMQQTFPAPGKIRARQDLARSRVDVARSDLDEKRNQLVGLVRELYLQLALRRQLAHVTRDHVQLVDQLIDAIRASYESGRAEQHDLLQLQVLRERLVDDIKDLEQQAAEFLAALNATLHRAPKTEIATPERTEFATDAAKLESLVELADELRPMLQKLDRLAAAERMGARRAESEKLPDLTGWLGYRVRSPVGNGDPGDNFVSVGASIPLPWFWNDARWGGLARQHEAQEKSAQEQRQALLDEIRGKIEAAMLRWRRAADKAKVYRQQLAVDQHRTLDAVFAAYRVDRADFATLYQAELTLLEFERVIHISRNQAARATVKIDTLTGSYLHQLDSQENTK